MSHYLESSYFFLIITIENIRSPIANSLFHSYVSSKNRATMGSILQLFKSMGNLIILPIIGYVADFFSVYVSILFLAAIILINSVIFYIVKKE